RRNRPTVIVTIDHESLLGRLSTVGVGARTADGTPIPAETARRMACDANLLPVVLGGRGQPLDVGRSRRLATDAQRAALRTQHPNCAVEGCYKPFDWCDIHHIIPWSSDDASEPSGKTDIDNLVPLCSHHHRLVHEGGWKTQRQPNHAMRFYRPR